VTPYIFDFSFRLCLAFVYLAGVNANNAGDVAICKVQRIHVNSLKERLERICGT